MIKNNVENQFFIQFCFWSQVENILNFTMPKKITFGFKVESGQKIILCYLSTK